MAKHTLAELNTMSHEELLTIIRKLIEQIRITNNYRFEQHTETLSSIDG